MRFTACLAAVIMKIWDVAWLQLLHREEVVTLLYKRYVYDCRNLLNPLSEGWKWNNNKFEFDQEKYVLDMAESGEDMDQIRTTTEITKAM